MSDDALQPATPLTSCVINVDRAWHVAPYNPVNYAVRDGLTTDALSMLTIHDSQPAKKAIDTE